MTSEHTKTVAELQAENARLREQLADALTREAASVEQQTAIGHILNAIAHSPAALQPVLDAVVESASRLCDAEDAVVTLATGGLLQAAAHTGPISSDSTPFPLAGSVIGEAMTQRRTVHVHDIAAPDSALPVSQERAARSGWRTALAAPLLRESSALGGIMLRRTEVRPFTVAQIALLETFAAQAVIAIENTRLFEELKSRNQDLSESLEQQTATSEVLRVIASSPTDLQAVLDAVAENAARLCEADDVAIRGIEGEQNHPLAHFGPIPMVPAGPLEGTISGMVREQHRTVHLPDVRALSASEFPRQREISEQIGIRTVLAAPLLRAEVVIGTILVRRTEVRPFNQSQISLLETFADQAVIAIENTRLFKELESRNSDLGQSLEQQVAVGEVLRVIASSPTDLQSVLDTVAENAARLCDAREAVIYRVDGAVAREAAVFGPFLAQQEVVIDRGTGIGRAIIDQRVVHIPDTLAVSENDIPGVAAITARTGVRTVLAAPLLREGVAVGAILIRRPEPQPFTDQQIALLQTFADQAVIAIENTRLFQELEERNKDLSVSLEQQTATSELLRVIASSPTDLQAVLNAVAENAVRLCDATDAVVFQLEGDIVRPVVHVGPIPWNVPGEIVRLSPGTTYGRAIVERRTIHVGDVLDVSSDYESRARERMASVGSRTVLATPFLRQGVALGAILIRRTEVRPFAAEQIALLGTFADQAVIAIENTRLFQELEDRNNDLTQALEQQAATSEVLRVIASSPTDLQTVLQTVAENAARLCGAGDASVRRIEDGVLRFIASSGPAPIVEDDVPIRPGTITGRAVIERRSIHIHDFAHEGRGEFPEASSMISGRTGLRTVLATPLLREGEAIGTILIRRYEVEPFSDQQIALLETFADQAVIAIENTRLFEQLQDSNKDLAESLAQQTATSEVLRVIASSPTDLPAVLDAIAESAARVCDSDDARLWRLDGDIVRSVSHYGSIPQINPEQRLIRGSMVTRAILDRVTIHVPDVADLSETEYPDSVRNARDSGTRTMLVVPLMRDEMALGSILIRRMEVRPFTDKQIALLETFADQAVIAIENTRLFQELKARNQELDLALEQQTATGEVLRVIASSPTDLQTVLDTVAENAARLCGAADASVRRADGDVLRSVASFGSPQLMQEVPIVPQFVSGRAFLEGRTIHVPDFATRSEFSSSPLKEWGARSVLVTPLMRKGTPIGTILIRRQEVQPFTDAQIALLETFADQAVIAIENTRLFEELEARNQDLAESLEQQTATSEVLRVIASSPTDLQGVLDAIAESAARVCDSDDARLFRLDGDIVRPVAHFGSIPPTGAERALTRGSMVTRAILDRVTIHMPDLALLSEVEFPETAKYSRDSGTLTSLVVPLLREDVALGSILIRRTEARPFTPKQIALLETFADQAVIAIENARLFQELEDRNRDLSEALEQQTATGEVLRVIASSPADLGPVLSSIAESAARLLGAGNAVIGRVDGDALEIAAAYGPTPSGAMEIELGSRVRLPHASPLGQAIGDRRPIHVHNRAEHPEQFADIQRRYGDPSSGRTTLAIPLLRENVALGAILIRRSEVRPFSDKEVDLLRTFADQAVIAIENTRLFEELESRNSDLAESLEQQTATSEVLRVIASSPTDLQAVLDTVAENAARVCGANDALIRQVEGDMLRVVAHYGEIPSGNEYGPIERGAIPGRAVMEARTVHVHDILAEPEGEFSLAKSIAGIVGYRTSMAVPLLRQGVAIGTISMRRRQVQPFSAGQIQLLETFADQAVIAIENARLFGELESRTHELADSVEELQALGVVSRAVSSTLDLQQVLTTVLEYAVELSGMDGGTIFEFDQQTGEFHDRATVGLGEGLIRGPLRETPLHIGEGMLGRAVGERLPVQVADIQAEGAYLGPMRDALVRAGYRAMLAVPLLREDQVIGGLTVRRATPGEVPQKTVDLLQTFASQSALAIQNARLFNEIEEKSRQLFEASQHKSQFLANMSHELRTPLNAILGYTELILDEIYGDVPPKIAETLDRVQASGRHLLGLINDVLDLSKMEAGQLILAPQEYALAEVIQPVHTAVESLASEKGIGLRTELASDLPTGYGDDRRLVQVILNLVGNAIKFTDTGEVVIRGTQTAGPMFRVSVRDTGPGISAEQQGKIFEEFQQADTSTTREKGGTGLGLSIAKRIVELHGGRIWVESVEGQGSTFAFEIPVRVETL